MLVDDEVNLVETLEKRLNKRNIETITATSGEEGLELLKKHNNLDVIVLDIKMPGMDGIETLKQIKKLAPLTQVILLTGHATVESGINGLKLGAYDYLMKPCDIEELVKKIAAATHTKQTHEKKISNWSHFMEASTLKELMVPLAEYATVYEEASILEAVNALEEAQNAFDPKRYRHRAVLVLNEGKKVVGKLSQHDVIQALEPQYKESKEHRSSALDHLGFSRRFIESVSLQYNMWDRPLQNLYNKALEQKVKAFMHRPTKGEYIEMTATMNETIHRLIIGNHHSLMVTDGAEIVGIIRLTDVFEHIHLRLKTMHLAVQIDGKKESTQVTPG
jgi:DNA-binding response OmpR family regulator